MNKNLNIETIVTDGTDRIMQEDYSVKAGSVECYFKNLESVLIRKIHEADIILGCIAWLTNFKILKALSKKEGISIIISKEDFLKPDINSKSDWKNKLSKYYNSLPYGIDRYMNFFVHNKHTTIRVQGMSYCSSPEIDPIRVVGYSNTEKLPAFPRSHHKFLIFCNKKENKMGMAVNAYGLWTGSYNLSQNAERSFENAIYTTMGKIIEAYLMEWGQVAALSEKIDWDSDWVAPEWRIGS